MGLSVGWSKDVFADKKESIVHTHMSAKVSQGLYDAPCENFSLARNLGTRVRKHHRNVTPGGSHYGLASHLQVMLSPVGSAHRLDMSVRAFRQAFLQETAGPKAAISAHRLHDYCIYEYIFSARVALGDNNNAGID